MPNYSKHTKTSIAKLCNIFITNVMKLICLSRLSMFFYLTKKVGLTSPGSKFPYFPVKFDDIT